MAGEWSNILATGLLNSPMKIYLIVIYRLYRVGSKDLAIFDIVFPQIAKLWGSYFKQ